MQFWQQYHYLLLATVADAWRVMSTEDERSLFMSWALRWNRLVPLQISVCCGKAIDLPTSRSRIASGEAASRFQNGL